MTNDMDKKEYLLNEVGLQIARENIAKQMAKVIKNRNQENFKTKMLELLKDRDEVNKGNKSIIEKYVGGI